MGAGTSLEQAQLLAELFSGKNGLLSSPLPCNIAELQAYYSRLALHLLTVTVSTDVA